MHRAERHVGALSHPRERESVVAALQELGEDRVEHGATHTRRSTTGAGALVRAAGASSGIGGCGHPSNGASRYYRQQARLSEQAARRAALVLADARQQLGAHLAESPQLVDDQEDRQGGEHGERNNRINLGGRHDRAKTEQGDDQPLT